MLSVCGLDLPHPRPSQGSQPSTSTPQTCRCELGDLNEMLIRAAVLFSLKMATQRPPRRETSSTVTVLRALQVPNRAGTPKNMG